MKQKDSVYEFRTCDNAAAMVPRRESNPHVLSDYGFSQVAKNLVNPALWLHQRTGVAQVM